MPDLHAALSHIKILLAPGGRAVLVDVYAAPESALRSPQWMLRRMVDEPIAIPPVSRTSSTIAT